MPWQASEHLCSPKSCMSISSFSELYRLVLGWTLLSSGRWPYPRVLILCPSVRLSIWGGFLDRTKWGIVMNYKPMGHEVFSYHTSQVLSDSAQGACSVSISKEKDCVLESFRPSRRFVSASYSLSNDCYPKLIRAIMRACRICRWKMAPTSYVKLHRKDGEPRLGTPSRDYQKKGEYPQHKPAACRAACSFPFLSSCLAQGSHRDAHVEARGHANPCVSVSQTLRPRMKAASKPHH